MFDKMLTATRTTADDEDDDDDEKMMTACTVITVTFIYRKSPGKRPPPLCTYLILAFDPKHKPIPFHSNFVQKCQLGLYKDMPKSHTDGLFISSRAESVLFGLQHAHKQQVESSRYLASFHFHFSSFYF